MIAHRECPFCGAAAAVVSGFVMCGSPTVKACPGRDIRAAPEAWNTRMTPPQDSVSDVERLRAALHEIANVRAIGGHCTSNSCCARMENIAIAALAVPINKIGEDELAEAVRNAEIITREDSDNGWTAIRQSTLRTLLSAIRRLSTSTDKGVR